MRNALPEVRKWLEGPVGEFSADKTQPAAVPRRLCRRTEEASCSGFGSVALAE